MPTSSIFMGLLQIDRGPRRAVGLAALLATIAVAQGCVAASSTPSPEARVIVRFRPGSPEPGDAAFRARLASSAHVTRLDLVRPMSGDAYVMKVACADPDAATTWNASDACATAIKRLGATEWVMSVENDGREKHQ